MKTDITIAIIALMLFPTSLRTAERDDLPHDCANADFSNKGSPVMFSPRDGLSMGISTPHQIMDVREPVIAYVWVNNQTNRERTLMSCSMWWDWGIAVYDANRHAIKTHTEQAGESKTSRMVKICGRNKRLDVPPHSCAPLQDTGDVKIDLRKDRDLPVGSYFVTENKLDLVPRGLRIIIENKEPER